MAEEVKFSKEELDAIQEIQNTYIGIQNAFGRLGVSRIRLEQDSMNLDNAEDDLKQKYSDNQKNERDFVDNITKKYGDGQLNLDTGTFVPVAKPKEENNTETSK